MADSKITALTSISTSTDPANDPLVIVDVSDTSMAATGTTKKVTLNNLLACSPTAGGNFTITGDLTVDTNTLKVDSANNRVGIGTASPSHTLDVTSSGTTVIRSLASAGNQAYVSVAGNGGVVGASSFDLIQDGSSNAFVYNRANAYLAFGTNNSERLRIDATGNVGIGVTPANWATIKALQVGAGASLYGYTATEATLSGNTYYNTALKYVANGRASQYQQQNAEHRWFYDSGTQVAGANCSFVQAMTLDASGNLLVGVTSANASGGVLQLKSGITFPATQVASSDANTLDDYEEGTWTATLKGSVSDPTTPVTATGRYTKIGRQVSIQLFVNNVTTTGASGRIQIDGLPFANNGSVEAISNVGFYNMATFTGVPFGLTSASSTVVDMWSSVSAGVFQAVNYNPGSVQYVWVNLTYTV